MRTLTPLLLGLLLLLALPVHAQDLFSSDSKSEGGTAELLQKLLLGKVKEKSETTAGTKAGPPAADRLPRKAPATGSAADAATSQDTAAKPFRSVRPRPSRQADLRPMPRLKPAAPISASPTIQPPKPIPMPDMP